MDSEQTSRFGIAVAISVGAHLLFAIFAEVLSGSPAPKKTEMPPVEIARVAADGTHLPSGSGQASFNSPASSPSAGFGEKYNLDAGVPRNIPLPKNPPMQNPAPQNSPPVQTQPSSPINQPPAQPPTENPNTYTPPVDTGVGVDTSKPSAGSKPSTAGNQGQKRSRGPNRAALPEYTVEPSVPSSMMSAGVTNSVDVSVEIAADGSHIDKVIRTSGSQEVDALVLAALARWRWDPAAKDGQPVASTQNFKFSFTPR